MNERPQSQAEEIANSVSHGVGFIAAVASAPILIATTAKTGTSVNVAGSCVFAVTMVLLYCASMLYHAVSRERAKALLRKLERLDRVLRGQRRVEHGALDVHHRRQVARAAEQEGQRSPAAEAESGQAGAIDEGSARQSHQLIPRSQGTSAKAAKAAR